MCVFLMKDAGRLPPVEATRVNSTISITVVCINKHIARIEGGGGVTVCIITVLYGDLAVPVPIS